MKIIKRITLPLSNAAVFTVMMGFMIALISCGGCGSGKVITNEVSKKNDQVLNTSDDTTKYLFMDDPILRKLKLTHVPKAEVILEYDDNGNWVASHMFGDNGSYLGIFDPTPWKKGNSVDKFMQKYQNELQEPLEINEKTRELYWNELKDLGYKIPKNKFNVMRFISGNGLSIGPAIQWYTTENTSNAYAFIGTKVLCLRQSIWDDECSIFFHETYLFDYTGKLKKIYNYDEMGLYLMIFEEGKSGISEYRNSDWGPEPPLNHFRYHNFINDTYVDFNPHDIFEIFKTYPYSAEICFIDIKESKINIVYSVNDNENSFINLIIDVKEKFGYFKTFQFPDTKGLIWKFMTKPDGSRVELSEYEIIKF